METQSVKKSFVLLRINKNRILFLFFSCLGFYFIPREIHWVQQQLVQYQARFAGIYEYSFIQVFILSIVACLLISFASAWLAQIRLSCLNVLNICLFSTIFCIVLYFKSFGSGVPYTESFCSGFADRVAVSGIDMKAVEWADSIFGDSTVNPKHLDEVSLPPGKIPYFFNPIFGKYSPPEANVIYSESGTKPLGIEIKVDRGVRWGIWVAKSSGSILPINSPEPRRLSERFYIYLYFYK